MRPAVLCLLKYVFDNSVADSVKAAGKLPTLLNQQYYEFTVTSTSLGWFSMQM